MLEITIPLSTYLEDLLGTQDYVIRSGLDAERIREADSLSQLCVVENSPRYDYRTHEVLRELETGHYRIWYKRAYDSDNHKQSVIRHRASVERMAREQTLMEQRNVKDTVVKMLTSKGIPLDTVNQMLSEASTDTIQKMYDGLLTS